MPKGPQGQKRPADVIGCAVHVARIATGEIEDTGYKQPAKRKGGLAGAKARAESLSQRGVARSLGLVQRPGGVKTARTQ